MRGIVASGFLMVLPLFAHHSIRAEYDLSKTTTIQGFVTKVEWMNPHGRFYLDVAEADGKVNHWEVEFGSPNSVMKIGWTRDAIQQGDRISVDVSPAKDGSKLGYARVLTWSDGRSMSVPVVDFAFQIPR